MTAQEEFKIFYDSLKLKPNPNHYRIIDKYNYRIIKPHKSEIFRLIEKVMDEYFVENMDKMINRFTSDFINISDLKIGNPAY